MHLRIGDEVREMNEDQSLPTFAKNLNAVSNSSIPETSNARSGMMNVVIARDPGAGVQVCVEATESANSEEKVQKAPSEPSYGRDANNRSAGGESRESRHKSQETIEGIVNIQDKFGKNANRKLRQSRNTDSGNEAMTRGSHAQGAKPGQGGAPSAAQTLMEANNMVNSNSQLSKYINN